MPLQYKFTGNSSPITCLQFLPNIGFPDILPFVTLKVHLQEMAFQIHQVWNWSNNLYKKQCTPTKFQTVQAAAPKICKKHIFPPTSECFSLREKVQGCTLVQNIEMPQKQCWIHNFSGQNRFNLLKGMFGLEKSKAWFGIKVWVWKTKANMQPRHSMQDHFTSSSGTLVQVSFTNRKHLALQ